MQIGATLIGDLGNRVGLGDLGFDEKGQCLLVLDEKLFVAIVEQQERWIFYGMLGQLSADADGSIERDILAQCIPLMEQTATTIAVDPNTSAILLIKSFALDDLDIDKLENELAAFVDRVELLTGRFGSKATSSELLSDFMATSKR